eukprot:gnl/TRDRNA2_/TRDRNA2_153888_c2_seq1.p1 gnl/TRDRNA2_/TRDRNA2_153888_c2~~gnl/TRDRNA2_/TRDRNA2_153888_c2_seq1.p1  ORF type:complete len:371 (+),score=74.71 gnl/TRDRNA2_/TRDRNA2_153888_c2_seq1:53-1114(+)
MTASTGPEGKEKGSGSASSDLFAAAGGREAFLRDCIHRKLQQDASALGDRELSQLGTVHYNEQFAELERLTGRSRGAARGRGTGPAASRRYVGNASSGNASSYRGVEKESNEAACLRLIGLQQPPSSGAAVPHTRAAPSAAAPQTSMGGTTNGGRGFFEGLCGCSRDGYITKHIDWKLQEHVKRLGDVEVFKLGQERFGEQAECLKKLQRARQHAARADGAREAGSRGCIQQRPPHENDEEEDAWGMAAPEASVVEWSADGGCDEGWPAPVSRPLESSGKPSRRIPGLEAWLEELSLTDYLDKVRAWCEEMGAVNLQELCENAEDLSGSLGLRPLEHRRLLRAAAASLEETGS